jgi:hypothetical protein
MKSFNKFDQMFKLLERRSGNDPSRIAWLVKNDREVRQLVGTLYFWDAEFKVELAKQRFLRNVPRWFLESYKIYKDRFGSEVNKIYGSLILNAFGEDEVDGIPLSEILNPDCPHLPKNGEDNDPDEILGWFVPGVGGAETVDMVMDYVWNMHESSDHADDLRTGLDAWNWFTETVGVDLAGIEQRWMRLPRTLIPSDVERTTSAVGRDGLVELLDDATKAYIFGLPAAAVAMCRAICERVLKEFYFGKDQNGEKLGNLAILAEKKYEQIKDIKLGQYIALANNVMHNYRGSQFSDNELEVVRQFLETTKTLIEETPPPVNERP